MVSCTFEYFDLTAAGFFACDSFSRGYAKNPKIGVNLNLPGDAALTSVGRRTVRVMDARYAAGFHALIFFETKSGRRGKANSERPRPRVPEATWHSTGVKQGPISLPLGK
jgi:hypothetical protein